MANGNGKDKLLDRIRKLMALSTSPNENEAAAAMAKAQAMLIEHNLSMAEVALEATPDDDIIIDKLEEKTDSVPWARRLAMGVANLYFCKYFFTYAYDSRGPGSKPGSYKRRDIHSFVGAGHNTAVAKLMFVYLMQAVDRLARDGAKSVPSYEKSKYTTSFKAACAGRLSARISERIAAAKAGTLKTETGSTLPAVIYDDLLKKAQEFMESKFPDMRTTKIRVTQSHFKGVNDGRAAGNSISLDGQLTDNSRSTRMIR